MVASWESNPRAIIRRTAPGDAVRLPSESVLLLIVRVILDLVEVLGHEVARPATGSVAVLHVARIAVLRRNRDARTVGDVFRHDETTTRKGGVNFIGRYEFFLAWALKFGPSTRVVGGCWTKSMRCSQDCSPTWTS